MQTASSTASSWRGPVAGTVWLLHTSIVTFFVVGWALPWRSALWVVVVGSVALRAHWWLNQNTCMLTALEQSLRGAGAAPTSLGESSGESFVGRLAKAVLGRPVPASSVEWVTHGVLWTGAGIALVRLILE